MDTTKNDFFEDTYKLFTNYVDDRILLLKIQTAEKTGKFIVATIKILVVALLLFLIILFLSVMGALYFSKMFESYFLGFAMMTGIYIFLLLFYLVLNKYFISKKIMNSVITGFFEPSKVEQDLNHKDYE